VVQWLEVALTDQDLLRLLIPGHEQVLVVLVKEGVERQWLPEVLLSFWACQPGHRVEEGYNRSSAKVELLQKI